eukprot:g3517.t1
MAVSTDAAAGSQLQALSQNVRQTCEQMQKREDKYADMELEDKMGDVRLESVAGGEAKGEEKGEAGEGDDTTAKELFAMKNNIAALLSGMRAEVQRENDLAVDSAEPKD